MSSRRKFRVIKLCQKLYLDIVEMQGTADKRYRYTICSDLRHKSEKVIHLVRKSNKLTVENEMKIQMQIK